MKRMAFTIIGILFAVFCSAQEGPYQQEGIASFYGREFDGRPTSSGQLYNSRDMSAAHPTLPFGTVLKVTNKNNFKSVNVTVNDRGPFVADRRIIDVSEAAAEQLDMVKSGTAPVIIETTGIINPIEGGKMAGVSGQPEENPKGKNAENNEPWEPDFGPASTEPELAAAPAAPPQTAKPPAPQQRQTPPTASEPAPKPAREAPPPPVYTPGDSVPAELIGQYKAGSGKLYRLQVGSYRVSKNAVEAFDKLKAAGLNPSYERYKHETLGDMYRVVLSQIKADAVQPLAEKIGAAGFQKIYVREE